MGEEPWLTGGQCEEEDKKKKWGLLLIASGEQVLLSHLFLWLLHTPNDSH